MKKQYITPKISVYTCYSNMMILSGGTEEIDIINPKEPGGDIFNPDNDPGEEGDLWGGADNAA